jgi:hypothetical protein
MVEKHGGSVDIVITEKDLPPIIEISETDLETLDSTILVATPSALARIDQPAICIGDKDLPPIICVDYKDLPPIIQIGLADLPADLSYMTTECYHGTTRAAAEQIMKQGFKVGQGTGCGAGIYFSVGAVGCAHSYAQAHDPCIIRARVNWGKVAYLDDPKIPASVRGSGEAVTRAALKLGYDSIVTSSKFSTSLPAIGIVLGMIGDYIKTPRIMIEELIDPRASTKK